MSITFGMRRKQVKVDILIAVAEKGGVENVINMTAPYLQEKGWEVRIVQLVWEGYNWVEEGIPFFPLLEGREGHDLEEFAQVYTDFIKINGEPQVVLATAWPYMCYVAKKAAFLVQKEMLTISWLHEPIVRYEMAGYGSYDSLFLADAHLAISKDIYTDIQNNCKETPVLLIRNPVDFSKIQMRHVQRKVTTQEKKKLFFVGRLDEQKRVDVIIRAMSLVKDAWELHVIGEGAKDYEEGLKKIAQECNAGDCIRWYGWKNDPWCYVKDADAMVMASDFEGFPLTAIEAQANGISVIATPTSGITELIKPGKNGFLYPFGDFKALAEILMAIDKGILPKILPEECKRAVEVHRKEISLADFEAKLREIVYCNKQLLQIGAIERILYSGDKISIIVPCYNAEKYIAACIESIFAQTVPLEMLEMIFIDDVSTDRTCQIIKSYEERYPENILLIECEKNAGLEAARNIGLQYATGDYIIFVDADEFIKKDMVQKQYEKMALYQYDIIEWS